MLSVNSLCQEAAEECSMVGVGEALEGTYAAVFLDLLNHVLAKLNNDNYFSSCQETIKVSGGGHVYFKQLVEGEEPEVTVVNMEPPECINGVSRRVGIRYLQLEPSEPQDMATMNNMALPTFYTYQTNYEVGPDGKDRLVGDLWLNGSAQCDLMIFVNRRFPTYKLTDKIPVSPIYHDAIMYSLAYAACIRFKLDDYKADIRDEKNAALAIIDRNTMNTRVMNNGVRFATSYDQPYYDGMAGNGLTL